MKATCRLAAAYLLAVMHTTPAVAENSLNSFGFGGADSRGKLTGIKQTTVLLGYSAPDPSGRAWMPDRFDLSLGSLQAGNDSAEFISFGPSWQRPFGKSVSSTWFMDFGVHPTLLNESRFDGEDIGGTFHFTSHFGVGKFLDYKRKAHVLLRVQHTSNAGLDETNPGVDMIALTFWFNLDSQRRKLVAEASDQLAESTLVTTLEQPQHSEAE